MCKPAAGAALAGPAALVEVEGTAATELAAGAAFGAAESSHPATAAITATGRTRARAARWNREIFCVVMEMSFHGFWILLDPATSQSGWELPLPSPEPQATLRVALG